MWLGDDNADVFACVEGKDAGLYDLIPDRSVKRIGVFESPLSERAQTDGGIFHRCNVR